ncbi:MAG TPA: aminoacetone oxidase family FAD-binding enzyme, partial [Bacteroidia bacterium]|nr:aminoacetone oxidase family FAD-binding enzyme [Bacteroidia bacterium]
GPFSRFSTTDTVEWFESRGVKLKTETDGRMFPVTDDSATVINCLQNEAALKQIEILTGHDIIKIEKTGDQFLLTTKAGEIYSCLSLLIASGGFPKSVSYEFIRETGHHIIEPVPSLFTFNMPGNKITQLMGVSVQNARVRIENTTVETEGPLLITHWGMSGPAILKSSAWGARVLAGMNYNFNVRISWLPAVNEDDVKKLIADKKQHEPAKFVETPAFSAIPKRLWQFLLDKYGIVAETRWADLSKKMSLELSKALLHDIYPVRGKTTFKEEFVTCGGVALDEIDFRTMESKKMPGLFFAGEVLDIDGVTGGFNFQSAWTTGWIAALGIKSRHEQIHGKHNRIQE